MTIKELDERLKKVYPQDNLHFIEYQNMRSKCQIKCNSCGTIFNMCTAESAFRKKNYFCPNCNDTLEWKIAKENFKIWLKEHSDDFILIDDLDKIHDSQSHIKCKCVKCGLIQQNKKIYDYYNGKSCFCKTKSTKKPQEILQKELKKQGYELLEEYINTDTTLLIKRLSCNHIFKGTVSHILRDKYYCPYCHFSKGEETIKEFLDKNNISYISQYKIFTYKVCYIDFYIPELKIFIEFNGKQHYKSIEYFGGDIKFEEQKKRDNSVKEYCNNNGIQLLEISYLQYKEIEKILEKEVMQYEG